MIENSLDVLKYIISILSDPYREKFFLAILGNTCDTIFFRIRQVEIDNIERKGL